MIESSIMSARERLALLASSRQDNLRQALHALSIAEDRLAQARMRCTTEPQRVECDDIAYHIRQAAGMLPIHHRD